MRESILTATWWEMGHFACTWPAVSMRLGLDRQVHLRGAAPASVLPGYFRQADVFVLSSLSEGLPVVLMEAMASGLPVVGDPDHGCPGTGGGRCDRLAGAGRRSCGAGSRAERVSP